MDFPAHKKIGAIPAPVNMRKQRSVKAIQTAPHVQNVDRQS
jgi:hypothetical protein